jgi:hypothetical protein
LFAIRNFKERTHVDTVHDLLIELSSAFAGKSVTVEKKIPRGSVQLFFVDVGADGTLMDSYRPGTYISAKHFHQPSE